MGVTEISEAPSWSGSSRDGSSRAEVLRDSRGGNMSAVTSGARRAAQRAAAQRAGSQRGSDELGAGRRGTRERHARKSSQKRRGATALSSVINIYHRPT